MTQYITIQNLIDCRLASPKELVLAYRRYMEQGDGQCLPMPKSTHFLGGIDINSKDFLFYKCIKVGGTRVQYDTN